MADFLLHPVRLRRLRRGEQEKIFGIIKRGHDGLPQPRGRGESGLVAKDTNGAKLMLGAGELL